MSVRGARRGDTWNDIQGGVVTIRVE